MTPKEIHNPILPRLARMRELWFAFEQDPASVIGCWTIAPEEFRMIEVFYEVEQTEEGEIPSLFIRFDSSFSDGRTYGESLFRELQEIFSQEENAEVFKESGFSLPDLNLDRYPPDANSWLAALAGFAKLVPDLEGAVVAYLNPEKNDSPGEWVNWLMDLLDLSVPPKVKMMVADLKDSPLFLPVQQHYPQAIRFLDADLDMNQLLREVATHSGANPSGDPGILFRQTFVQLIQSSQPNQIEDARHYANEAISIAKTQKWPHLEAAVHLALGSALINNKLLDDALGTYDGAFIASLEARLEDKALGARLGIQAMMGKGAVFLQQMEYPDAAKAYEEAGRLGDSIADHLLSLEAWRMAGFSNEMEKDYDAAWDAHQKAFAAGGMIKKEDQPNSTLPFVGAALLRLAGKTGNAKEELHIREQMERMAGPDWEKITDMKN